jgi:FkbM family methyltransferase
MYTYKMTNPKKYYVSPILSNDEIAKLEGQFCDRKMFNKIIDHDADVYRLDENNKPHVLFHFRKKIIPKKDMDIALDMFKEEVKKNVSTNRGKAGGPIDVSKLSSNIKNPVNEHAFKSKIVFKDGSVSKYYVANKVNSIIAGYYDKPTLREKHTILENKLPPCRTTAFTKNNFEKWPQIYPLIDAIDNLYSNLAPSNHMDQKVLTTATPEYVINNSVFSTITANYNWRTALHTDKGDYHKGLTALLVATEGNYKGGYLGYPQYGICVDVRHGDFILQDAHQYHCNTEIIPESDEPYTRLSMIFYYREDMTKCSSIKNAKSLTQKSSKLPKLTKLTKSPKIPLKMSSPPTTHTAHTIPTKSTKFETIQTFLKKNKQHPLTLIIRPNTTDIKVIDEVLVKDVYEKPKLNFEIKPDDVWLDLGGNIGTFTLACLTKGAKVITYEPEPENLELLKMNIDINFPSTDKSSINSSINSTIVPTAVGIKDGQTDLYLCKGDYNKYRHTIYKKRGRTSIKIPIQSIHGVFKTYPNINAVKMDIEGAEIDILENMKLSDWKKTNVEKLVFEYSFDIDRSIPRFLKIIKELEKYFSLCHYTKVKKNELEYNYFPAMTMVYCLK